MLILILGNDEAAKRQYIQAAPEHAAVIENIETGVHFTRYEAVARYLSALAEKYGVLATTQSIEFVDALLGVLHENGKLGLLVVETFRDDEGKQRHWSVAGVTAFEMRDKFAMELR